jgi:hypothetical protein
MNDEIVFLLAEMSQCERGGGGEGHIGDSAYAD